MKLIASLILATSALALAEVKVTTGEISDRRTTGEHFKGLEVSLKVSGPEMAACKGMRVVVKSATDDAGNAIKERNSGFNDGRFDAPREAFGFGFGEKKGTEKEYEVKVELENPARAAKAFTLDAEIELLIPANDPAAVITADVAKLAGKPLENDALKAGGVSITLKAPEGQQIGYEISDAKKMVASVEFCAADGTPLKTNGSSSFGFGGKKTVSVNLEAKAPAGVVAKIYLLTEKAVVKVPVKLPGVALP